MQDSQVIAMTAQALNLVLILSLPTIVTAAVAGTVVALLQALTQVQEQTLSFVIKLIAVVGVLFLTGHWFGSQLFSFGLLIFDSSEALL